MIAAQRLTKRFGSTVAVEELSFEVAAGELVGLVGHDGAGKTTTLGMLVGHVTPTSGSATILERPYRELEHPLRRVGVLRASGLHPGRSARDHLRICVALGDLDPARIGEVLRLVGLERDARRPAHELPAGARRRLAIAAALLGDPEVVILDEPADGLDADGARWLSSLLRELADDGRTVLVSSAEPDELDAIADRLLVLDRGSLLADSAPDELTATDAELLVRTPGAEVLAEELRGAGIVPSAVSADELRVRDAPARAVGELALKAGVPVWEIREQAPSLEQAVVELRDDEPPAPDGTAAEHEPPPDATAAEAERTAPGATAAEHQPPAPDAPAAEPERPAPGASAAEPEPPAPGAPAAEHERRIDAELAALAEPQRASVVAVLAPATGLGRTTLAFLIADALAACAGFATLAVALSCDHDRIGLAAAAESRTSLGLADLLGDLPDFDEAAHISPYVSVAPSGAHALAGESQPDRLEALEAAQVDALLDFAGRFYALVVVDVGGLGDGALRAVVRRADRVLLLGAPGAVEDVDERSAVLRAIEEERDDHATLVFNRVDEEQLRGYAGPGSHVLIPRDRELIRALDGGGFELAAVEPVTRYALKRLALAAAEGIR